MTLGIVVVAVPVIVVVVPLVGVAMPARNVFYQFKGKCTNTGYNVFMISS